MNDEPTWDTAEVDRWLSNDEGYYNMARRCRSTDEMRHLFEGADIPGIDWDEVDWDYVFEQFEEDRDG